MEYNVCHFVPRQPCHDQINILHFVLETKPQSADTVHRQAHYALYYVAQGHGRLHIAQHTYDVHTGDMFFTLPAVSWSLESDEDMHFFYISFLGVRANALTDQLGVNPANCVYSGFMHLDALWRSGLDVCQEASGLRSEGILLYAFSEIARLRFTSNAEEKRTMNAAIIARKYVDDHFADPGLTLESAGRHCGYHPKYLSAMFTKAFHIRFSDYLNTIRIQHACVLMEQGMACIKDIAGMCGYTDAMYFSRVFKKHMRVSPKEHCAELRRSSGT